MDLRRERVLFGAAYYHEYQPSPRLETDLDLMADAGFSVIRVGESVWTTWEPEDGRFELEWLAPVLDGAERVASASSSAPRHTPLRRGWLAATPRSPAKPPPVGRCRGVLARRSTTPTLRSGSTPSG